MSCAGLRRNFVSGEGLWRLSSVVNSVVSVLIIVLVDDVIEVVVDVLVDVLVNVLVDVLVDVIVDEIVDVPCLVLGCPIRGPGLALIEGSPI